MNQFLIYYPVFTLVILTALVLGVMFRRRVAAVKNKELSVKYFKTHSTAEEVPELALQAANNYTNLHETPLIFYVICLFLFVANKVSMLTLSLAWAYTLSRFIHSYIHLNSNKVQHRFKIFGLSWTILIVLAISVIFS